MRLEDIYELLGMLTGSVTIRHDAEARNGVPKPYVMF